MAPPLQMPEVPAGHVPAVCCSCLAFVPVPLNDDGTVREIACTACGAEPTAGPCWCSGCISEYVDDPEADGDDESGAR